MSKPVGFFLLPKKSSDPEISRFHITKLPRQYMLAENGII
jgi:hypothetical protein